MINLFYNWRFYSLGREQYSECMNKIFANNLSNLHTASTITAILVGGFSLFPLLYEGSLIKTAIYFFVAIVSFFLGFVANYNLQRINVSSKFVYGLITVFYLILMVFGAYISVWEMRDSLGALFFILLMGSLLLFAMSPVYVFLLICSGVCGFIILTVIIKEHRFFAYDVINAVIAGAVSLYFNWQIAKLRLSLEYSTGKLEEERSKYYNQSTTDELTQLRNRRDYMQTFQRFLSNYRASDDWFCVAICDIDFFKNYNDHYGHPKGDECLRVVSSVLGAIRDNMGVYAARVGGEEFSLLWFEKEASHVDLVVKEMMRLLREKEVIHEKSKVSEYVTMSVGVYVVRCGAENEVQKLYDSADKALYMAKNGGRNCAVICGDEIKQYKIVNESFGKSSSNGKKQNEGGV